MEQTNDIVSVIFIAPGCEPQTLRVANTYESLRALLGGPLERIHGEEGLSIFGNDEAQLLGLPPNLELTDGTLLAGALLCVRENTDGYNVDVTPRDVAAINVWAGRMKRFTATYDIPAPVVVTGGEDESFMDLFERANKMRAARATYEGTSAA